MKKGSLFYYIYFGCVIFFVLLVTVGLIVLHSFLKTYEAAQPKSIVQNICEQYFKNGKLVELKNQYNFNLSDYETDKSAESAFAAFTEGKELNIYHSSQVPEGSELCYAIKTESNPVALIALSKSEDKFKFGISGYKVDSIKLNENMLKSVTLTFPSNAKISVNGKKLSNKDIVNSSLPDIKNVTFGDDAVYSCSAVLDNLLDSNIEVTVEGGEDWNVIGGENSYAIEQRFSEELTKQIEDFAIEGSKVYAAHMQDDAPLGKVSKYVDSKTEFYKNIVNTIVSFAWSHDSYDYEDVKCSSLIKHSDEIYSCRVAFNHVLKLGSRKYKDIFDKRVYVRVDGKNMKIIDMQNMGE